MSRTRVLSDSERVRSGNLLRRSEICAPESTHNNGVKVPFGQKHWSVRSGRQLRRRETGWGAPEANDQSISKTKLNTIRPDALASPQVKGEAKNGIRPGKGGRKIHNLRAGETVSSATGMHGVIGDRMVRSWSEMNQGSPAGEERSSWPVGPKEPAPEGDRAFIVARKRGNARGAKGGRKVEA